MCQRGAFLTKCHWHQPQFCVTEKAKRVGKKGEANEILCLFNV